jgi:hypothetical protein
MWSIASILQHYKLPQLISMSCLFIGSIVTAHLQAGLQNICSASNFPITIAILMHSDSWTLTRFHGVHLIPAFDFGTTDKLLGPTFAWQKGDSCGDDSDWCFYYLNM